MEKFLIFNFFILILSQFVFADETGFQNLFNSTISSDVDNISYQQFVNAVRNNGYPSPTNNQHQFFKSQAFRGQISTKEEAAMALAHFIHETGGLIHKREIKCLTNPCNEYAVPGCDYNGQKYFGRGYIQLTWCQWNYKPYSIAINNDQVWKNPDIVASDERLSWDSAYWFWGQNVHNRGGSTGKFGETTKAINPMECSGDQTKARNRFRIYGVVRSAFGLSGSGNEGGCYN